MEGASRRGGGAGQGARAAVDTRSNAAETAQWVRDNRIGSLRLVTSDWHMRRAVGELLRALPPEVEVTEDAVRSQPSLRILFLEYHKLLASAAARAFNS
ncbi:YdcF family protein [Leptolyngbya sp. 15MV]|nr:YdcF family protein [Leptolyngbya sp. 15MV]